MESREDGPAEVIHVEEWTAEYGGPSGEECEGRLHRACCDVSRGGVAWIPREPGLPTFVGRVGEEARVTLPSGPDGGWLGEAWESSTGALMLRAAHAVFECDVSTSTLRERWRGDEGVTALSVAPDGALMVGTERGRVFCVAPRSGSRTIGAGAR